MTHRIFVVAAWACLVLIAALTLLPQGFRPHMFSQRIEHFLAFGAAGLLFGLAYPRRLVMVAAIVLGSAVALEALQLVTPDRHANLVDLIAKIVGGTAGLVAAVTLARLRPRK
jgi:VanZ family protein